MLRPKVIFSSKRLCSMLNKQHKRTGKRNFDGYLRCSKFLRQYTILRLVPTKTKRAFTWQPNTRCKVFGKSAWMSSWAWQNITAIVVRNGLSSTNCCVAQRRTDCYWFSNAFFFIRTSMSIRMILCHVLTNVCSEKNVVAWFNKMRTTATDKFIEECKNFKQIFFGAQKLLPACNKNIEQISLVVCAPFSLIVTCSCLVWAEHEKRDW